MNKRKLVFGFEFEVQFPPNIAVAMTPFSPERVQMDPCQFWDNNNNNNNNLFIYSW